MSLFDSTNICSQKPITLSLQEKSPEIYSDKKSHHHPSKFSQTNLFSPHKTDSFTCQKDLKLSYEIDNSKGLSFPPIEKEIQPIEESYNNFKHFILETIKKDEDLTLREKIVFSFYLVVNENYFDKELIKEFNEEECHLSLLNWIWRYNKKLKQFQLQNQLKIDFFDNFGILLPQYNKLLIEINIIMELLINILNFLIFLPVNSSDILDLKLYEKLTKIKGFIKSYANDYLLNLINFLLNKWKTEVDSENEKKIIGRFKLSQLGIKRPRSPNIKEDKEETEADSIEDNDENNKIYINNKSIINSNLNKKTKNKNNIKVSFDLSKNSVIYFKKDDIPFKISLDKQINEKNILSSN